MEENETQGAPKSEPVTPPPPEPQPAEPAEPAEPEAQTGAARSEDDPSLKALVRREARKLARRWVRQRESKRNTETPVEAAAQPPEPSMPQQQQPTAGRRFVWERFRNARG